MTTISKKKEKLLADLDALNARLAANEEKMRQLEAQTETLEQKKRKLTEQIKTVENIEYGTVCREYRMGPEELAAFLAAHHNKETKKGTDQ